MQTVLAIIAAGALLALLGGLIRYRKATYLIAGFDENKISDTEGLSEFIGLNTLYIAALTTVVGLLEFWEYSTELYWILYGGAVLILTLRMIYGARNYR